MDRSNPPGHGLRTKSMVSLWMRLLVVASSAAVLVGCQTDEIRTYQVPKPDMTRLLGAILPHGENTWFFKVSGPGTVVNGQAEEFANFLQSLRFDDGADKPLSWTLPEGWKTDRAERKDRYATIRIGDKDPLELSITKLGREGQASSIIANVNRWRGQLALPPIAEDELGTVSKEFKLGSDTVTVVSLEGAGSGKTGGRAPMAGGGDRMRPKPAQEKQADIAYKAPNGWNPKPNNQFSRAAFEIRDGGEKADVTVTPLGAGGGELSANVNRWRGQIGLQPQSEAEIRRGAVEMAVDNKTAQYFDLKGSAQRILGVRIEDGGTVWFGKMTGPDALVEKQKANFEAFVKSLRFTAE
jgi:hypothetical protein